MAVRACARDVTADLPKETSTVKTNADVCAARPWTCPGLRRRSGDIGARAYRQSRGSRPVVAGGQEEASVAQAGGADAAGVNSP